MPQGKGTYGSQVGRPPKEKDSLLNDDRERYVLGGVVIRVAKSILKSGEKKTKKEFELSQREIDAVSKNKEVMSKAEKELKKEAEQFTKDSKEIQEAIAKRHKKETLTVEELVELVQKGEKPPRGTSLEDWADAQSRARAIETRGFAQGGEVDNPSMEDQMEGLAISVEPITVEKEIEEQQLPDEEMEADYVDFVVNSTLSEEDQNYLEGALAEDTKLSELFDQVVESASEFSGSGPIEGPGTEVSDSIPARLSDGEFVFTAKATEEIGEDSLMSMMKDAEAAADERQGVAYGGVIDEEDQAVPIQTRGSVAAQGNVPNVVKQSRQVEEEMLKSSPRRYYVPVSG